MVYCGKPSKSCAPCRHKRTKCDLKQPSCSQCIRAGRLCSGYRDLSFKDQNQILESKYGIQETFMCSTTSAPTHTHRHSELHLKPVPSTLTKTRIAIPQGLALAPEASAASFFFDNFIPLTYSSPGSLYGILPQLYSQAPADSAFTSAITALGLTYLSNALRMPRIMVDANREYAKVLGRINKAIRDPTRARDDQTLLIVMLLGLYEENNTTSRSMDPWTNHVKGALALVELRGDEQLHRPLRRPSDSKNAEDASGTTHVHLPYSSYFSLTIFKVVNCLIRRREVPESIIIWSELAQEFEDSYELLAENQLAVTGARFCNLQARIESQGSDVKPEEILESALGLDARLIQWADKWRVMNPFEKATAAETSADVFSDYWHLYSDHEVASHWNHYRSVRIELHRLIGQQSSLLSSCLPSSLTSSSPSTFSPSAGYFQFMLSKTIVINLSHEICASIPYFMGKSNSAGTSSQRRIKSPQPRLQLRNTAHARLIVWPLFVVGRSPFVSDLMRLYAAEQLERIGNEMWIWKAKTLGQLVRVKQEALGTNWRDLGMWDG